MRKKAGTDDTITAVMPNDLSSKESRQIIFLIWSVMRQTLKFRNWRVGIDFFLNWAEELRWPTPKIIPVLVFFKNFSGISS